jgi:hypothetical protein
MQVMIAMANCRFCADWLQHKYILFNTEASYIKNTDLETAVFVSS